MSEKDWPDQRPVSIIVDPPGWFTPFAKDLAVRLEMNGFPVNIFDSQESVTAGCIAFYLSCTGITPPERLELHNWNIVVHASDLPQGRGFSPLVWQILEGKNIIPVKMIIMEEAVDTGDIVMERKIEFKGHELSYEMREILGQTIVEMCFDFVNNSTKPDMKPQQGNSTWYRRRNLSDSQLDPKKTIEEQFNLLRVVDNQAYPAFFNHLGHRYTIMVKRQTEDEQRNDN